MSKYTHPKGKGYGKYNGMLLADDWTGQRIVATEQIANRGGHSVKPGMSGIVTGVYRGLDITFDVCEHCGTVLYVSRVDYSAVALADHAEDEAADSTRCQADTAALDAAATAFLAEWGRVFGEDPRGPVASNLKTLLTPAIRSYLAAMAA